MPSTIERQINRITGNAKIVSQDLIAVEEPLEIRLSFIQQRIRQEKSISITMRTPGNDKELAIGFLFTEGIIENRNQISSINTAFSNSVTIRLNDDVETDIKRLERNFYTSSSCGICGKSSIDSIITTQGIPPQNAIAKYKSSLLYKLPEMLRSNQNVFEQTGGLHACGLFDESGRLTLLREDVGRHNALDKLIGAAFLDGDLPLENKLLVLSGRASFELIQKATMAGIPLVAAVGAPSSLAVQLAEERHITLVGFLKKERFNIYSVPDRIELDN